MTEPIIWRGLTTDDLPALARLMRRVLAADGGLPVAADEPFLRSRYLVGANTGAVAAGVSGADELVAAGGLRPVARLLAAAGVVDPARRGQGLGTHLVAWAQRAAGLVGLRFETESLTPEGDALFRAHGLRQSFAEEVMRRDLTDGAPQAKLPDGITLAPWSAELAERFFHTYQSSFADRPGNPGWSAEQWVEWISEDDDFAPEWTFLATRGGEDLGFVAAGRGAWIVQVGVVPSARGTGLGAGLTTETLRRMRADGATEVFLDVNVDNPGAARVYRRLGFAVIGERARYEPVQPQSASTQ